MPLTMPRPEQIAVQVGQATCAHEHGVVVTTSRSWGETLFVMWAINRSGKINSHQLDAHVTDADRLKAHVEGFIENHKREWAAQ